MYANFGRKQMRDINTEPTVRQTRVEIALAIIEEIRDMEIYHEATYDDDCWVNFDDWYEQAVPDEVLDKLKEVVLLLGEE